MPRKPTAKERQHRADLKWRRLRQWVKEQRDFHLMTSWEDAGWYIKCLQQMDRENRRTSRPPKG